MLVGASARAINRPPGRLPNPSRSRESGETITSAGLATTSSIRGAGVYVLSSIASSVQAFETMALSGRKPQSSGILTVPTRVSKACAVGEATVGISVIALRNGDGVIRPSVMSPPIDAIDSGRRDRHRGLSYAGPQRRITPCGGPGEPLHPNAILIARTQG